MKAEVRVYHTDQGNKYTAIKVESFQTMRQARERVEFWSKLGFIAVPLRANRVEQMKAKRQKGWGKIQYRKILVGRDRERSNARKVELRLLRKQGLGPAVRFRSKPKS